MKNFVVDTILDLIYPRNITCIGCGREIEKDRKYSMCHKCLRDVNFIEGPFCKKCGIGIIEENHYKICGQCQERKHYNERGHSCTIYDNVMKKIMSDYKFNDKSFLYQELSNMLSDKIQEEKIDFDYILAVPINKKKKRKRGYDQVGLMCKRIEEVTGKEYIEGFFTRKVDTKALKKLSREDREKELNGAISIECKKTIKKGSKLLIIDDIYTTGTTLNECGKELFKLGYEDISYLVVSRGQIEG